MAWQVLVDAVLDPALPPSVADALLLSILSAAQTALDPLTRPLLTTTATTTTMMVTSAASSSTMGGVRRFFRVDEDIQRLLSPFTDLDTAPTPQTEPISLRSGAKLTRDDRRRCAERGLL